MENSIIDLIYNRNSELHSKVLGDEEYRKTSNEADKAYNELMEALSEGQQTALDNFVNLFTDQMSRANEIYFKEGVKTGFRFAMESLDGK